jgi:hypothetical protein
VGAGLFQCAVLGSEQPASRKALVACANLR